MQPSCPSGVSQLFTPSLSSSSSREISLSSLAWYGGVLVRMWQTSEVQVVDVLPWGSSQEHAGDS